MTRKLTEKQADERDAIRLKIYNLFNDAMEKRDLGMKDIADRTGLAYHIVRDAVMRPGDRLTDNVQIVADCLGVDVSFLLPSKKSPPTGKRWTPKDAHVIAKPLGDDRYMVTIKSDGLEQLEVMTSHELEDVKLQYSNFTMEETPTMVEPSEPLAEINEPEIWIDGRKYTRKDVTRMVEDSVRDHRKIDELESDYEELSDKHDELKAQYNTAIEQIGKLNEELQTLTDKFIEKDKECMKLKLMNDDLHAEIDELKTDPFDLESMTIKDSIQMYRTFKRLFTDEVLK